MSSGIPHHHPGRHLAEYLEEYGISRYRLAESIHVPPCRIDEIVRGRHGITADTALSLGCYFGTSAQFRMNLQTGYDLSLARRQIDGDIRAEIKPLNSAA